LRYCAGLESDYFPPVVLAVEEAIKRSAIKLENSRVVILGRGFLVGAPLVRYFNQTKQKIKNLDVLGRSSENKDEVLANADLIISAVGAINVVKAQEIKKRAVLIDAGTTEINGALLGDIEHEAYSRSRFYTPVPGGIGPVTIAQLMKNVISSK
jgi:methylenetetrahydrofolate dehydrogenase (NADP+)/methenyltetrahydrofolate cyclohydrolase